MVVSTEVFDALKGIGLNLYERKIFVALLAKGIATAGEVSSIAKVPRSRSYDILESLAEKGFVILQPSKPIKYVALEPKDALERVKANMERNNKETLDRITKLTNSPIIAELETVFKQGFSLVQPFEMTGTIKGRNAINQQLRYVFKQAKDKITVVTTKKGFVDLHANHYNALKKLAKKGVKVKIYAPLDKDSPANQLSEVAELNHVNNASGRVCTVDDEHVIMALTDDNKIHESQDVVFWANSPHVVKDVVGPLMASMAKK